MQTEILDHQSFSDHYPVLLRRAIINTEDESKIVRDTSFLRYPSFVEKYLFVLSDKTFSKLSNSGISSFTAFYEVFLAVTEHYAPFKQINPSKKNLTSKWFDNKLKNLRSERNRAHSKWKRDPSNLPLLYRFKEIRIRFEKNVKSAKRIYYKNMFDNCLGDSRKTFALFNESSGKTRPNNSFIKLASCISDTKPNPSTFEVAEKFFC